MYTKTCGRGLLAGMLLLAGGCAHESYRIASMTPAELKGVSDVSLCHAQQYWQSPQLSSEIAARRLDCRTGLRAPEPKIATKKKAKKPGAPAAGVAVGTVSPAPASPAPVDLDAAPSSGASGGSQSGAVDLDAAGE